jgi:Family of unknown function (DUF5677)
MLWDMAARTILTRDEYHLKVRQNVDALKARLNQSSFSVSDKQQDKVLRYFMERAAQVGEACFRTSDLQMPLFVLARVLSEDFFTMYWASLSEANAAEYCKVALSEVAKMIRHNLKNKRARVREVATGNDVTARFLPELDRHVAKKKTIEQLAKDSGLSKVYDIVYRYDSLEVHGNTFGLSDLKPDMDGTAVAVSAINAFLRVILLVADNKDRPLTADEVLSVLNMRSVPGT